MAGAIAYILIAGAVPFFKDIFSDDIITAELFKMAVNGGLAHVFTSKRRCDFVCSQMTVGILFKVFKHYLALLCFICHIPFLSQIETEFHFHITVLLYSFK